MLLAKQHIWTDKEQSLHFSISFEKINDNNCFILHQEKALCLYYANTSEQDEHIYLSIPLNYRNKKGRQCVRFHFQVPEGTKKEKKKNYSSKNGKTRLHKPKS